MTTCWQPMPPVGSARYRSTSCCDTGVFDDGRYFDVQVDYAKAGPTDLLARIAVQTAAPTQHRSICSPHCGSGTPSREGRSSEKGLRCEHSDSPRPCVEARHERARRRTGCTSATTSTCCSARTRRTPNGCGAQPNATAHVKDGVDRAVVHGDADAVNSESGTKVAAHWQAVVPGGGEVVLDLRLTTTAPGTVDPFADFDDVLALRQAEADEFYASVIPASLDEDRSMVHASGPGGDVVDQAALPLRPGRLAARALGAPVALADEVRSPEPAVVPHLVNDNVISMPDKWEYPWYAAWDLAFHMVPLAMIDPEFAREQLALMLSSTYLHPSGQIPAYEWNFGDVNPPVHAAALALVYGLGLRTPDGPEAPSGRGFWSRRARLPRRGFQHAAGELHLVGQPEEYRAGRTCSRAASWGWTTSGCSSTAPSYPGGGTLEQSDGTAWMAFFSQSMLELALALAEHDPASWASSSSS